MKRALLILSLLGLAACGADGEPTQPVANASVSVGSSGVNTHLGLGVSRGPFSIYLGI
jgi:hypothetical protein